MRNHRPDKFYYHTNIKNATCEGKYWEWVKKDEELWSRIEIKYLEAPTEIFGQKLSEGWRFFHGSDIGRIRVFMQYGGIYLDNDCFVLHSLDKYRKFECVVNWDENQFLGTQAVIAHKNSRFIALWLQSYKDNYHPDKWSFILLHTHYTPIYVFLNRIMIAGIIMLESDPRLRFFIKNRI
jgi:hypothetical protein